MTVYLVGAGPGDPGLISVRGLDLVRRAEVIVHDRLGAPALLSEARADAVLIDAGKAPGRPTMTQEQIDACLVEHGLAGRLTVRLKGGDPFVFGRGGEEALALAAAGVPFEVVPGISSAIAAPAFAGIPVTHRGLAAQLTVVTGHEEPGKEQSGARLGAAGALRRLDRPADGRRPAAGHRRLADLRRQGSRDAQRDRGLGDAGRPADGAGAAVTAWARRCARQV